MPDKHYKSRKEWNAAHYKRIVLDVPPETHERFRAAAEYNNRSMRQQLIHLVGDFIDEMEKKREESSRRAR